MSNDKDLRVGDRVSLRDGAFKATWKVVEIIEAGARLAYEEGTVRFVGYDHNATAPNGAQLTGAPDQGFIGRAHWDSVERVA